jgi:hypothetical protein
MIAEIQDLVELFHKKYGASDSTPKMVLYGDGSGHIEVGSDEPFFFLNVSELIDHLNDREIQPWY